MTKMMIELIGDCYQLCENLLLPKFKLDDSTTFCLIMYLRSQTYPVLKVIKNDFSIWKGNYTSDTMTLSEVINEIDCIRERLNDYDYKERR